MRFTSVSVVIILVISTIVIVDFGFEVIPKVRGKTIYVDDDGGANYTTIYEAVWAADSGDTIFVFNGTYSGASTIDKSITLIGEDRNNTIMEGKDAMFSDAVHIEHDFVNISGFTIINWSGMDYGGIKINGASYINITDNIFISNLWGIYAYHSSGNTIANNTFSGNTDRGISFESPSLIPGNLSNQIYNNDISNGGRGISIENNPDNYIFNNIITNNTVGIYFDHAHDNVVTNNLIYNNSGGGITLWHLCNNNNITENMILNNEYGIHIFDDCNYNNIIANNIINNNYGAFFNSYTMDGNLFHKNNFVNNNVQADGYADWDNGYPSGGNFWSDYNGSDLFSGPFQDIPGSDGIGDTQYNITTEWVNDEDNYPLIDPWGSNLYLSRGWNLVSISTLQNNTDPGYILESIKDNFSAIQFYNILDSSDPWKHYNSEKHPMSNDLNELDHKKGFWIKITEPKGIFFECPGAKPESNQSIPLFAGWNMVGYPSFSKYNRNEALNNLNFGTQVDAIWTYNARAQKWEEVGESDYFIKGRGYWIHAKTNCVWEVPL